MTLTFNTNSTFPTHDDGIQLHYEYQTPGDLSPTLLCPECLNRLYNKGMIDRDYVTSDYFDPGVDIDYEVFCDECGYPLDPRFI